MTQEDLAREVGVSRQSVSKWESSMAMPDLDKIMKLSKIFSVSTDFLLNDDMGLEQIVVDENTEDMGRVVDVPMLNDYYDTYDKVARSMTIGLPLLILSPFPVLALEGTNENLGIIMLLVMVAAAVGIFINAGFTAGPFEFIYKEPYSFSYGVEGIAEKTIGEFEPKLKRNFIFSVVIYILAPITFMVSESLDISDKSTTYVFLLLIAMATSIITYTLIKYTTNKEIIKYRDPKIQKRESNMAKASRILWVLTFGIYLVYSFATGNWSGSWILFVIAGAIQIAIGIFFD